MQHLRIASLLVFGIVALGGVQTARAGCGLLVHHDCCARSY
jgi:hypothetical protein